MLHLMVEIEAFLRFNETLEVVNSGLGLDYSVNSWHKKIKNAFLSQVRLNENSILNQINPISTD